MGRLFLPIAAVILAMAAFQVSASFAKALFPVMGAYGAAAVRLLLGAMMLLAFAQPWRNWPRDAPWWPLIGLGVSIGGAVTLFYAGLSRLPQGVVIALQFLGPLAVALFASRRPRDLVWAALAAAGVWGIIAPMTEGARFDVLGLLYALGAAAGWAGYILFGRVVGPAFGRSAGALATAVAAVLVLPVGVAQSGAAMLTWSLLPLALLVALFSTVIPFSLELYALPRMPAKTFAVFMSLEPAFGALSGLVLLHERLAAAQLAGIAAVMVAAAGAAWSGAEDSPTPPPGPG